MSRQFTVDSATSFRMRQVRREGTKPELQVRKIVYQLGSRYRLRNSDLPGSPDIANRSGKWAIFVHGCYWHGHTGCSRGAAPVRNREYWAQKIQKNRARDARVLLELRKLGFATSVIWECELRNIKKVEARIQHFLSFATTRSGTRK